MDEQWAIAMAEAERRASASGREDVAEYLSLRNANDLARSTAIEWLLATFQTLAGEANRAGASIQITQVDAHRFATGSATMVGSLLALHLGVRQLLVEAGWPRRPQDGFVRGGGLASAQIRHLGRRAADEELLLVRTSDGTPVWFILEKTEERTSLSEARVRHHIALFLGRQ
ncbi:MAG: hypothetical protein H0X14_03665 [Acidobacteria bacterium]|nr:hypothetical protein [Acidobacteriota bacterium]